MALNMPMNGAEAFKLDDDFYAEYEEEYTESWGVFGNQSGFCYATLATEEEAEREAARLRTTKTDYIRRTYFSNE